MAFGQEHVPQAESPGLLLELIDEARVVIPSRVARAQLGLDDGISAGSCQPPGTGDVARSWTGGLRDAFFLYELGHEVQRLLCPLAHSVFALGGEQKSWA